MTEEYKDYGLELVERDDKTTDCEECVFYEKRKNRKCPAHFHPVYGDCGWTRVWKELKYLKSS